MDTGRVFVLHPFPAARRQTGAIDVPEKVGGDISRSVSYALIVMLGITLSRGKQHAIHHIMGGHSSSRTLANPVGVSHRCVTDLFGRNRKSNEGRSEVMERSVIGGVVRGREVDHASESGIQAIGEGRPVFFMTFFRDFVPRLLSELENALRDTAKATRSVELLSSFEQNEMEFSVF
ncbi:hypothetical protein EVAR_93645_1 [Eumeta japonica]|uniref:Uncharacterized protein n=1 Tax=Eumeta variegata TaxID=151549 RepID=A0A4C1TQN1_EUMVA|nr:hypothetical protein EVAR_93645_1 [Eumeta japonica]